ncbi:helix-turn-helix domain-containing protein [Methylomonas lenta]|uniref:helix-turn-helix domain-containing protein n=1 Tax=Methylomonas lenta TaxID=980561 RepID=UPI0018DC7E34|nr:helix-turn-helix domain-containing protein [Methylomonas lenta]
MFDERGVTKEQLADQSDVSESFIGDLTRGRGNPSLRKMELIAKALDYDLPVFIDADRLEY